MSLFRAIAENEMKGIPFVLCTIIESKGSTPRHVGSKMLVYADGRIEGTVGGGETESRVIEEARQALISRKSKILQYKLVDPSAGDPGICGGQVEVFVEPIMPKITIVVVGAGHVGQQVVFLAKWLGYRVIVNDDRAEFCTPDTMPGADEIIICPMEDLPKQIEITPQTYIVIATRGSDIDIQGLPAILDSQAGFIGVIGSHRRWENTKKGILNLGDYQDKLSRVHSPIGLELHAETPEEIAVSILAEIMMGANQTNGKSMSER
jgi:xanthine dehydrogenase accessory factor